MWEKTIHERRKERKYQRNMQTVEKQSLKFAFILLLISSLYPFRSNFFFPNIINKYEGIWSIWWLKMLILSIFTVASKKEFFLSLSVLMLMVSSPASINNNKINTHDRITHRRYHKIQLNVDLYYYYCCCFPFFLSHL